MRRNALASDAFDHFVPKARASSSCSLRRPRRLGSFARRQVKSLAAATASRRSPPTLGSPSQCSRLEATEARGLGLVTRPEALVRLLLSTRTSRGQIYTAKLVFKKTLSQSTCYWLFIYIELIVLPEIEVATVLLALIAERATARIEFADAPLEIVAVLLPVQEELVNTT